MRSMKLHSIKRICQLQSWQSKSMHTYGLENDTEG